jgi:uncharacterized protein YbbK (DUF523 family)
LPTSRHKPLVGVSQCLLGDRVRYDGKSKADHIVLEKLSKLFQLVPICPEVEAGLGIPRPPVQLSGSIENPRLTGRDDSNLDVTDTMLEYSRQKSAQLEHLAGFIFKSRSPSCGLNSTPVYIDGECVTESSRGVFARAMLERFPMLPVIEDFELQDKTTLDAFIKRITSCHTADQHET